MKRSNMDCWPVTVFAVLRRFRHAAVSALMGSSNFNRPPDKGHRMADVVNKVHKISDAIKQGKAPEGRRKTAQGCQ